MRGLLMLVVAAALLAPAAAAEARTVWLCKPGLKDDPCRPRLSTTVFSPAIEPTAWLAFPRAYSARCSSDGGASVLQITPVGGAPAPRPTRWHEYPRVLGEGHVGRALLAGATTVVCLIVGAMAAYALTRFEIPFKRVLMMLC